MKALVIGRGVQGKRWENNLRSLGYDVRIYGRDYKDKLNREEDFRIIIVVTPYFAFGEVMETLRRYNISSKRLIIEKPGASNFEEYKKVIENANRISSDSQMFLPLYIQYKDLIENGIIKPRRVTYVVKLNLEEILYKDEKCIYLKSGRCLDPNVLRDLFFHPASLFFYDFNILSGFFLDRLIGNGHEKIYFFKNIVSRISMVIGRSREEQRTINGSPIKFDNPMMRHINNSYEELRLDKLPKRIWIELERHISLDKILMENQQWI